MKIIIFQNEKQVRVIEVGIELIVSEAERKGGSDPINATIAELEHILEQENFSVKEDELAKLRSIIADSVTTEAFPESVELQVKNMKKLPFFSKKTEPINPALQQAQKFFEGVISYPDDVAAETYSSLIGLDEIKERLVKEASLLIASDNLEKWSKKYNKKILAACKVFEKRTPLIVFAGDVGTGKTALAESFGNEIARQLGSNVHLLRVSVQTRGTGLVGEMTQLIGKAFNEAKRVAEAVNAPIVLLVDEADTLAQSREESQMHHEDKAGVNALIQGIDHVKEAHAPILVVFCTNRMQAIDPAIIRRAAIIHEFVRPNNERLKVVFKQYFGDLGLTDQQLSQLADASSPTSDRNYGFTYSDITNRVIPATILRAYPDRALEFADILETIQSLQPTPPFEEGRQS